jgi:hypothetical protein
MGAGRRGELPKDLLQSRRRFQAWRERRSVGSRIPRPLWALAVRLANRPGVSRTDAVLGLDYYSLKKQVESAAREPASSSPAFVELPAPVVLSKQGQLEVNNGGCNEANPIDSLTQLQRHADQVAARPELWMPWNYCAALT